ncbi:MAG: transketolase, partial [Alphaproteobacteria bacterium]|nr:transketolase [Alphaproteobacteria bacterium]
GIATGLAQEGHKVVAYSIGNFPTLRPLEQIRNDAAYHNANVKIVCVGGGFSYGALGMSHHATEDLSILRALPNVSVLAPATDRETAEATRHMMATDGVFYLRLERASTPMPEGTDDKPVTIGKIRTLREGSDVTFVGAGAVLAAAFGAAEVLAAEGISCRIMSAHTVKPLDADALIAAAKNTRVLITLEENTILGGLGGAVAEILLENGAAPQKFLRMGIPDTYTSIVGDQKYLMGLYGLETKALAAKAKSLLGGQ